MFGLFEYTDAASYSPKYDIVFYLYGADCSREEGTKST